MFKEEKIINGILHYRDHPEAEFIPYTHKELSNKLQTMEKVFDDLIRACKAADHTIASIIAVREGIPDDQLQDIRSFIQKAIESA
jgi:hypothetical protein